MPLEPRFNAAEAIAKATATLLSKFPGSALVKNLNRIQGVVLGTVDARPNGWKIMEKRTF